jgi:hypothetical protein
MELSDEIYVLAALHRRLSGQWRWCGRGGEEKNFRSCWELIPDSQVVLFVVDLAQYEMN